MPGQLSSAADKPLRALSGSLTCVFKASPTLAWLFDYTSFKSLPFASIIQNGLHFSSQAAKAAPSLGQLKLYQIVVFEF